MGSNSDLSARPAGPLDLAGAPRPAGTRLRVHLTVDVECSHGGVFATTDPSVRPVGPERRIWGRIGSEEYGIRRMMDLLEAAGLPGTFYLEPFCAYAFGEEVIGAAAREVRDRGHGLELHLHPGQRAYRTLSGDALAAATKNPCPGKMWAYPESEQQALIEEGIALLESFTGERPRAFRAGGYAADEATLRAVRAAGLAIDSSAIHPVAGNLCRLFPDDPGNAPRVLPGLLELPVTTFPSPGLTGVRRRILEVSAITVRQAARVLEGLDRAGVTDAVLMLHSFSFLRAYDLQYRRVRPDRLVMRRFGRLLRHLAGREDRYEVVTAGDLADRMEREVVAFGGPSADPSPGLLAGIGRDLVQAFNRR